MIHRGRAKAPPDHAATERVSEADIQRIRLASTLAEERRLHALEIVRLQKAIEGLKAKLTEAHARLGRRER